MFIHYCTCYGKLNKINYDDNIKAMELDDESRAYLFWVVCVPLRIAMATGFAILNKWHFKWERTLLVWYTAVIAFGFTTQLIMRRKVGFFGGHVWWKESRYLHALTHVTACVLALLGVRYAYILLFIDIGIGVFTKIWASCGL